MNREDAQAVWERLIINMTHKKYVAALLRGRHGHDRLRARLRCERELPLLFTRRAA